MAFLKPRIEKKLVGVYVPLWMHSYLTLYALGKGISKSDIIKPLIEIWVAKQRRVTSDDELVNGVAHRMTLQWRLERLEDSPPTFPEFKEQMREGLLDKGLRPEHVDEIISKVKP